MQHLIWCCNNRFFAPLLYLLERSLLLCSRLKRFTREFSRQEWLSTLTTSQPTIFIPLSRHLLLSGGPVFTEDLWLIVSEGLREAVHTTLSNLRDLVACFQPGSFSVHGDEGMTVRVVARRDVLTADIIRLQQVAEQVVVTLREH